jgi:hypothetical protein
VKAPVTIATAIMLALGVGCGVLAHHNLADPPPGVGEAVGIGVALGVRGAGLLVLATLDGPQPRQLCYTRPDRFWIC